MTEWIRANELLDRLPAPRRSTAALIKTEFLGKKEVPPEIPLRQAVATGTFAQAHARGVNKPRRVFDLVISASATDGMLVVVPKGAGPRLVPAAGFDRVAAVVIDLLVAAIRSNDPVPA